LRRGTDKADRRQQYAYDQQSYRYDGYESYEKRHDWLLSASTVHRFIDGAFNLQQPKQLLFDAVVEAFGLSTDDVFCHLPVDVIFITSYLTAHRRDGLTG